MSNLYTHRALLPFDRYQIILLDDRDAHVWTTCPESLCEVDRPRVKSTTTCRPVTITPLWQQQATTKLLCALY